MSSNTLYGTGINQEDLVDLLVKLDTKFSGASGLLAKLDADAQVTATDYRSTLAVTWPAGIEQSNPKAIRDDGVVLSYLNSFVTNFNLMLAALDSDALGGMDNNYASTLALETIIGTEPKDGINLSGYYQSSLIHLLNQIVVNWAALLAKLDADPLGDSDYVSTLAIADNVDSTGAEAQPGHHA